MFQFPGFAPGSLRVCSLQLQGLPHSDTSGSIPVCGSPDIFAAYRVLLRLPKPRHPPYALASLSLMNLYLVKLYYLKKKYLKLINVFTLTSL